VKSLPLDRLMIETDAPYLLPRTLHPKPKSRRNEPQHLPEVLRVVAEAMHLPIDTVAEATSENAKKFFRL
jgi:TatD DNase family protein